MKSSRYIQTESYGFWYLFDWKIFGFGFNYTPYVACAHIEYSWRIEVFLPFVHIAYERVKR